MFMQANNSQQAESSPLENVTPSSGQERRQTKASIRASLTILRVKNDSQSIETMHK